MNNRELKEIIGDNVRTLRNERGLTQEELAELVGRDPSAIAHIERYDRLVGVELLIKFANVFMVSVDSLVRPRGSAPHLTSIISMLSDQSDEDLARLEPIIRAWVTQYGELDLNSSRKE